MTRICVEDHDGASVSLGSMVTSRVGNPYFFTGRRLDVLDVMDNGTPHRFTDDVAGLTIYDFRARRMDPVLGRFLQRDPVYYSDGMNLYEYVRSRPTRLLDPFGLLTVHIWEPRPGERYGHVSITLEDNTHISWWPGGSTRVYKAGECANWFTVAGTDYSFRQDIQVEGPPDHNIQIVGLNEDAIKLWWERFLSSKHEFNSATLNCSTVAADALKAGGADVWWRDVFTAHSIVWRPVYLREYVKAIKARLDWNARIPVVPVVTDVFPPDPADPTDVREHRFP